MDLSARRRVWGRGVEPGSVLFRRGLGDRYGAVGKAWTDQHRQGPTPAAGRI